MSLYGRFFASSYDRILAGSERAGLAARRQALLAQASGRTLELGAGTGANLEHYPAAVTDLTLTEPDDAMAARLDRRCARAGRPARIVRAGAERLPFADDSFDTVVCTLVLCTVAEPSRALAEVDRVLGPQGRLLFLEHVRSLDPKLAAWQDRLNRFQRVVGRGCNCNRPTPSLIESAGLRIDAIEHDELPKVYPILRPMVTGRAVARG